MQRLCAKEYATTALLLLNSEFLPQGFIPVLLKYMQRYITLFHKQNTRPIL